MTLSEEQVLALAPDEASAKAGVGLAVAAKWLIKASSEEALWGECQGSGSKPYQTAVDLRSVAFKCSCPSRKFPCKHGLALLLLRVRKPDLFLLGTMPDWVALWISKRGEPEQAPAGKPAKPADQAAQRKRQESREKKVAEGMEDLLVWLKDLVRNGLMHLSGKPAGFWEQEAKRMIDAQSPGVATLIRELGNINYFKEGWQSVCLEQLLHIYLLAHGYLNRDLLPPLLQHDVRSWIGFTRNQDELREEPGIHDTWLVLGKQVSEDDQITIERFWLHGTQTGQSALILQFIIRGQGAVLTLTPGMFVQAELVYFPSVAPLRAVIKKQAAARELAVTHILSGWEAVLKEASERYAQLPLPQDRPYVVEQLRPVLYQQTWWLQDRQNNLMEIDPQFRQRWKLLAMSGGAPLNMALVGKEHNFEPIGVWDNDTYKSL